MSDDFEAHPTNISATEAAETTLRIFLDPPSRGLIIQQLK
jgi:hypothetical protein